MARYDARFLRFVEHTLKWEGGDTTDTGGRTRYGIAQNAYPYLDVTTLTRDDAIDIYYHDYYVSYAAHIYSESLAQKYFDLCVNVGTYRATRILQRAVNRSLDGEALAVDGLFGPTTARYVDACGPRSLLAWVIVEATMFYNRLGRRDKYRPYLHGWLNRLLDI